MDIDALKQPLDKRHVKQRQQAGRSLSYIEAWHAIAEANRIFGFLDWHRETVDLVCVSESQRKLKSGDGWTVTYRAKVRVTVGDVIREGSGAGHGLDRDLGQAHESALKEAESDAMKRALMTFGNPFGLALYDKQQREVGSPEATAQQLSEQAAGWVARVKPILAKKQSAAELDDWAERNAGALEKVKAQSQTAYDDLMDYIESAKAKLDPQSFGSPSNPAPNGEMSDVPF